MSKQISICLKTAWLAGATTVLLMGTGMCVSTDATCFEAGDNMLFLMFWLGFPTSSLFIVASQMILHPVAVHSPSDFITAWMVVAFGGFLQWFVLVPRFFQKHEFTVLKLQTPVTVPSADTQVSTLQRSNERLQPAPVAEPIDVESAAPIKSKAVQVVSKRTRTRRRSIKSIAGFDRTGRTPLERVIDHL
jgi:hypothetical protein